MSHTATFGACRFDRYVPTVHWFSDSIPYGVGCATLAGPREPLYNMAAASGQPIRFVGTQSFAGNGNGLAVNPQCDCVPGLLAVDANATDLFSRMLQFNPRIVIYSLGINDIIAGASASTVVSRISTSLDLIKAKIGWFNYRIIVTGIMRSLVTADNAVVQAANALIPAMLAGKSYSANLRFNSGWYDAIQTPMVGVNMNDNVHPNDVGVPLLAASLWTSVLSEAVGVCRGVT